MRKIIVGAMVSMDGVMQAPGGPTEDPTKGFKFGGWEMPHFDQEFGVSGAIHQHGWNEFGSGWGETILIDKTCYRTHEHPRPQGRPNLWHQKIFSCIWYKGRQYQLTNT